MNEDHKPIEEQALRSLLHGAVEGLEPSEGALDRLRYEVPVRRIRKRRAVVGAAAAVLLAGAAIPTALHLTAADGGAPDHPAMAGHGELQGGQSAGSSDPHQNGSGAQPRAAERSGRNPGGAGGTTGLPSPVPSGAPATGPTAGSSGLGAFPGSGSIVGPGTGMLPPPAAPGVPGCSAEQLGVSASARPREADGKVYGSFKVTNVSARGCTVLGPDSVTAAPASGPAPGQGGTGVAVVEHTAGDPAAGLLPDPSKEAPLMLLAPNAAYEVRFAYVPPAQGCAATTSDPVGVQPQGGVAQAPLEASGADPGGAGGAGGGTGTGSTGGTGGTPPTTPAGTGVAVSHTPSTTLPGAATTQTTIPDACGGTVYRTGVIPVDAPAKP
ncbi:hypothetical protein [Streptomyces sp. NPDC060031]|uniref:hypothetical protein n=1 Tax=Streptomyces sp. NPDC060031 TaxID=3347043 RepID=UPI0036981DE2